MSHSSSRAVEAGAPTVVPSLLAADFGHLEREIGSLEEAGAAVLHLDVMDGHFVPNISFGLPVLAAVRKATRLPLDVHLMISRPERYLRAFREAGADLLTIHVEAVDDAGAVLREIKSLGARAGLSLNPPTPVEALEPYLGEFDLALTMSVQPGFGGQEFQSSALEKLRWLRRRARSETILSIDGGVNDATIGACATAGADWFVVGTALFAVADYRGRLTQLTALARSAGDGRFVPDKRR